MLQIKPLTISEFFADPATPGLLAEYAAECRLEGLPEPEPHQAIYLALERAGAVALFGAYGSHKGAENGLVGFVVVLVSMNPHYSQVLGAVESFFVAAEHRPSGAGLKLLERAEREAKYRGAIALLVSAPFGSKLAHVLWKKPAYDMTNEVFCKVLA